MRNSPPGMRTRSPGSPGRFALIVPNENCSLRSLRVHAVQDHPHAVADRKLAPRALAHHLADVLLIGVLVARAACRSAPGPSMNRSASSTNRPYFAVLMISASKSSPTRSAMNFTFFHSTSSRSASAARRSDCEHSSAIACSSAYSQRGSRPSQQRRAAAGARSGPDSGGWAT